MCKFQRKMGREKKTSFKPHVVCTDEKDKMFANGYEAFEGKGSE